MWVTKMSASFGNPKHGGLSPKVDVGIAFSNWVVTQLLSTKIEWFS
jgi:hypothetical protein